MTPNVPNHMLRRTAPHSAVAELGSFGPETESSAMKQYDVVRVAAIRDGRFASQRPVFQRHPQVGDVGTILEVYSDAFEVECSEQDTGATIWLEAMFPDELQTVSA